MAVSSQQIIDFLLANPSMSDADIASAMATYGVSPSDMAKATGTPENEIISRVAATVPPQQAVLLGDTWVQPNYQITGSGEDQQIGGIESVQVYKTTGGINDKIAVGTDVQNYTPTGEYQNTTQIQDTEKSFLGGLADAFNDPVVQAAFLGLGGGSVLGNALGLTGSTAQAVGTGLFKGGTALAGGASLEDSLKSGLLSGGLVYGGNLLAKEFAGTSPLANSNVQELNAASDLASNMADQGMSLGQINQTLQSVGYQPEIITSALEDAANIISSQSTVTQATTPINQVTTPVSDTVSITGNAPVNLSNVISTIGSTIPDNKTVEIVDKNEKTQIPVVDTTALDNTQNLDTVKVVGNNPNTLDLNSVINLINSGNLDTTNLVDNVADTTKKEDKLTTSDAIRLASIGTTLVGLNAATQGADTGTQFPIIPVPEEWTGQPPTVVAPRPKLKPIDFGNNNLLMGTQWEKFLSPTYGQVPSPVQYSQPTNMSYNDLMSILGSKQGYPSASNLSINDIISGIQNQYGQTSPRTMG